MKRIAVTAAFVAVAVVSAAAESAAAGLPSPLRSERAEAASFVERIEATKRRRVTRGAAIDDPRQYGDWIADMERPAGEYRGRYQLRLEDVNKLDGTKA